MLFFDILYTVMSGCTFGFTGSYIFSQTIFTYRTGVHSKWLCFFIMLVFWYVVTSPINVLQMAPLFFFGATLIFIGYDLLYEWVRFGFGDMQSVHILFAYILLILFPRSSLRLATRSFFLSIVSFGRHSLRSKSWESILALWLVCWWQL
jgi:MFS superfamily sulfate permease-like transporter